MKQFSLLIISVLVIITSSCNNPDNNYATNRLRINIDENWKFALGNAADPAKDFNFKTDLIFAKTGRANTSAINPGYDDSQWRQLNLPHDWAVELPFVEMNDFNLMVHGYKAIGGYFPENSIGWYRKSFTIPSADSGKQYSLTFDGVFRDAMFWLNGFYLGNNESGYIGVTYPITDYINYEGDNILVVRVDASQFEGWFYEGAGIYRHVWLNQTNNIHIKENGVFIHTEVLGNKAKVNVSVDLENNGQRGKKAKIKTVITDRAGKILDEQSTANISLDNHSASNFVLKITTPRLWSLTDPYLYRASTIVYVNNKEVDRLTIRFGVRTIEISPQKGLVLNGVHIKIHGANNHQDHAGVGSALPDYLQYHRIGQLKNFGINAYRTSHNPPTPELLDACDSLGMLVLDETRLMNTSPEYLNQFQRLILRDRNHPSVFLWSIGNEEQSVQTNSHGKRMALTMMQKLSELDPTRTCTYAADVANVIKGINEVIPIRGFNYRHQAMEAYHNDHPKQAIIGTEMGSTVTTRGIYETDSVNCYLPDEDLNAPWWASLAEAWWPQTAENDWNMGGFIWSGFDYRGEPTPFHWPNINSHFGILDVCGFPKNLAYYYKSWWSKEDVLHISPHWNWPGKEGEIIKVWVNSNADEVELFLNGNSLGVKKMPRNSHLNWDVVYEPGTLEAKAWRNGHEMRAKVETTGAAAEIVLMTYKTTLFADGKDATVINIRAIDSHGRWVPDAQNLVTFKLEGHGHIIGVGNGDPSSHEQDKCLDGHWQRHLFNGYCQVILQAGNKPGIIKFRAESEGLWPGESDIHSVNKYTILNNEINPFSPDSVSIRDQPKMIGADISFLPQLEDQGMKFSDQGQQKDAIEILADHGFNYIRLRIFNKPENEKGYAPGEGWCDMGNTLLMAKRLKTQGMKFLLDFHYSDTWADPQKQFKPKDWEGLEFEELKLALKQYTRRVIEALAEQGTTPDMVQIGNEINHGMVWPEGHISHPEQLAELIQAGIAGVKEVDPTIQIMLHLALGGQHDETVLWLDQMMARGCDFDVLGLSFYPKWHGQLSDLKSNIYKLIRRYPQPICIVEYSQLKQEVNDLAFSEFKDRVIGSCIWEPLNTWEKVFDQNGNSNDKLKVYDQLTNSPIKNSTNK
ncbi:MAG: glycosyl hydrolase 53 family protein [Bacteroidales bacterium]|nr:glycosyl hydrolase 53 family protein [Bacteroidales bacterium]